MKFKIGTATYNAAALDLISLKDVLVLEQESADLGRALRFNDIKEMAEDISELKTDKERHAHPAMPWVLAVTIWASRRIAGERMSFGDAIDFPLRDLTWLKEPQDHKAATSPKARTRKGSAPVGKRPAAGQA